MNQIALVAGFMPRCENHSSVGGPCLGIDLASVRSAPFEKFVNTYIDLFGKAATLLELFDGCLHSFEPMIVVGLEFGIDGQPTRPVLFAEPSYRDTLDGHGIVPVLLC